MKEQLISEETLKAYQERYVEMQKHKDTKRGDELFLSTATAISEQIENMHVKAKIGDFEIENDGPQDLGGKGEIIGPVPMLLAALANCLEISALLYLSFSNLNVNSLKVKVEATQDKRGVLEPNKPPFPGFYDLRYTWIIDSKEDPQKLEKALREVSAICPANRTLRQETTERFEYL